MTDIRTVNAEFMLLNWLDSASGGGKVIFAVGPEDLEKFKTLTRKEGKRPGQRFMVALALVDEQEQPERIGPLCTLAVTWCRDPAFQGWLADTHSERALALADSGMTDSDIAARVLRDVLHIGSRRELDTDPAAARRFNNLIRAPYRAHLAEQ